MPAMRAGVMVPGTGSGPPPARLGDFYELQLVSSSRGAATVLTSAGTLGETARPVSSQGIHLKNRIPIIHRPYYSALSPRSDTCLTGRNYSNSHRFLLHFVIPQKGSQGKNPF